MAIAYRVGWAATGKRDLTKLLDKVAIAVTEFIYGALRENLPRVGRELHLDLAGYRAGRPGDFRIVYLIDALGHRVVISAVEPSSRQNAIE